MKKLLIIILLIILAIFFYGKFIEPKSLSVNEYTIETEDIPKSFKELKIVHFSDLLYNNDRTTLKEVKNKINEQNPDIVVFTGDLFHKDFKYKDTDLENLKDFLKDINATLYKYAVIGDNDESFLDQYKDLLYEGDFILLDNNNTLLFYKSEIPVNIIGLNKLDNIEDLLKSDIEYKYSIALMHMPDNADELKNHNVSLILSGHSLGGIIKTPFSGGLIKKDGASKYIDNYYELDNTKLYISNGLGYEGFQFRLLNVPSINVYRFK